MSWSEEWDEKPWYMKVLTCLSIEIAFWIVVAMGIGLYGLASLLF